MAVIKDQTDFAGPPRAWSRSRMRTCTRASRTRRCSSRSSRTPAATTTATSRSATRAVATSTTTAWSISCATRTASRRRSSASSTTRTARRTSRWCAMPTASAATSSRRAGWKSARRCCPAPKRRSAPATRLPIRNIPVGSTIHCIELQPGKGAQIARSAGTSATLLAREGTYAQVRLRSGEVRRIHIECRATIGEVANEEHSLRQYRQGRCEAPHGHPPDRSRRGDEPGRPPARRRRRQDRRRPAPVSPWSNLTKGYRTRNNKRTQTFIVSRRKK